MKLWPQVIGGASVAAGFVMFVIAIRSDAPNLVAVSWLVAGIISASLLLGLADIISRLERIEVKQNPNPVKRGAKAAYLPGWDPDEGQQKAPSWDALYI